MRIESTSGGGSRRGIESGVFRATAAPLAIGVAATAAALAPDVRTKLALTALALAALAFSAVCQSPRRWLYLFFAADLLLPPLPGAPGAAAIHVAPALAGVGIFAGVLERGRWRARFGPLEAALGAFSLSLVTSLPFAVVYSGADVAAGSAARIALFLIGVYVFFYAAYGPGGSAQDVVRFSRFLFAAAALTAAFACLDFYFHFPAPAGFSDQYVWLEDGVFRRAQGLFYDASTLGNLCACFLVYAFISLGESAVPVARGRARIFLIAGALSLATALMLSYSRASVVNVAVAMSAYAFLKRARIRRMLAGALIGSGVAAMAVTAFYPSFAANYWSHLNGTIRYLAERPDGVLSGRLTNWRVLVDFIASHPWQTLFGIGYKTLPYASYLGDPVIADNTWLSLLVETGLAGLGTFVALLALILKTTLRAAKSPRPNTAFLGRWTFCFWCGEAVQMMSGDLLTYWRVLPVYFWALGAVVSAVAVDGTADDVESGE
ncbi:MAG TPA: O-antigen ligase family protein [Bryobacteraceae bacterium]|nr:O-antigen ligase family protein [Bryobacteraceae bacterium]